MIRSSHHSGRDSSDLPPFGDRGGQEREESPPSELREEEEAAASTDPEVQQFRPRQNVLPDGRVVITVLNKKYIRNFNLQLIIKILFVKFNLIFFIQFAGFIHLRSVLKG